MPRVPNHLRQTVSESLKEGIANLDWEKIAGVKRGGDLDINVLN